MSNAIPKFSFSGSTIKSEEDLASLEGGAKREDKYFRPGTYQLNITKVEYQGSASDDRWGKFLLHLEGTGGKTIRSQIMVPFRDVAFLGKSGKNTGYPYSKFKNFMSALGIAVTVPTLETVLTEVFTNPDKTLVGRDISANIGYQGNYVGYMGKDEAGIKKYNITMKDGSVLSDASGKAMTFPEFEAALHHAEVKNIEGRRFVDVLDYNEGKAGVASSNW